jgi:twinfilin-like protein
MTHTMAIPGLLVHAEDVGVHVDAKIEIHEPRDLVFEEKDTRKGKFRSLWNRDGFKGTESVYVSMAADKSFLENLE